MSIKITTELPADRKYKEYAEVMQNMLDYIQKKKRYSNQEMVDKFVEGLKIKNNEVIIAYESIR